MTIVRHRYKLAFAGLGSLGLTYLYYKPALTNPTPSVPYIPPRFVWSSIPANIRKRFEIDPPRNGPFWNMFTTTVVGGAGLLAKGFINASQTTVIGLDKFVQTLEDPHRTRGIITVSNHRSVLDDPMLWGVLPTRILLNQEKMRWVLGAADICYTTIFKSYFFVFGKTIPTIRGAGIYQPGTDFAIRVLDNGGWIHIYPEAKVVQSASMIRFKWGVGRIVMDMETEPIIIPIWHTGMEVAKPLYGTKLVHLNKPLTVVFGQEVNVADILEEWKSGKLDRKECRIKITQRLYDALELLEKEYTLR